LIIQTLQNGHGEIMSALLSLTPHHVNLADSKPEGSKVYSSSIEDIRARLKDIQSQFQKREGLASSTDRLTAQASKQTTVITNMANATTCNEANLIAMTLQIAKLSSYLLLNANGDRRRLSIERAW
jgi:hypothetical protein